MLSRRFCRFLWKIISLKESMGYGEQTLRSSLGEVEAGRCKLGPAWLIADCQLPIARLQIPDKVFRRYGSSTETKRRYAPELRRSSYRRAFHDGRGRVPRGRRHGGQSLPRGVNCRGRAISPAARLALFQK